MMRISVGQSISFTRIRRFGTASMIRGLLFVVMTKP